MNNTQTTIQKGLLEGIDLYHQKEYTSALKIFLAQVKYDPMLDKAYFFIAKICLEFDQVEKALSYAEIALEINPDSTEYLKLYHLLHQHPDLQGPGVDEKGSAESKKNSLNYIMEDSSDYQRVFQLDVERTKITKKKLLLIYDFNIQPYSIGDVILFIQTTILLNKYFSISQSDFAFIIHDEETADQSFATIDRDNIYFHLFSLIPLIQLSPYIGQVFIFQSMTELVTHISPISQEYQVFPPRNMVEGKIYLNYFSFHMLSKYFEKFSSIPWITLPRHLLHWAGNFYQKHVFPDIPVSVNLRNNPQFALDRNSDFEIWKEFFKYCNNKYRVKFIIICGVNELSDIFNDCSNVILAKEFHTSIENDLALIQKSAALIGAASGPSAMALFSEKPYYIVNSDLDAHLDLYKGSLLKEDTDLRFSFSKLSQRYGTMTESLELLIDRFEHIYSALDGDYWDIQNEDEYTQSAGTWLR